MTTTITPPQTGRISWVALFENVQPGDTINVPARFARTASDAAWSRGFSASRSIQGDTATITIRARNNTKTTLIASAEARHANVAARSADALKESNYWLLQSKIRTDPQARTQALAAHAAWKMTYQKLRAQILAH